MNAFYALPGALPGFRPVYMANNRRLARGRDKRADTGESPDGLDGLAYSESPVSTHAAQSRVT